VTRVLLADDHPMIQAAVSSLLGGSGYDLVAMARSGEEAIAAIDRHRPEIVILDIQMPGGTGLDVLRRLRERGDPLPVVLLTASIDDKGFAEALALKVEGILLKSSDPALLLDCLETVRSGDCWIDPDLERRPPRPAAPARVGPALTPRECELVGLVRKGLRNREIARRLGVTEGTVKVYLHSIFDKARVANRTELAMRADELIGGSRRA